MLRFHDVVIRAVECAAPKSSDNTTNETIRQKLAAAGYACFVLRGFDVRMRISFAGHRQIGRASFSTGSEFNVSLAPIMPFACWIAETRIHQRVDSAAVSAAVRPGHGQSAPDESRANETPNAVFMVRS